MNVTLQKTSRGTVAVYQAGPPIADASGFLDLLMSSPEGILAVGVDQLPAGFLDLKTRIAGELLQKVSTYRRRLMVLGDFAETSGALADFIRESNRGGQVVFVGTVAQGVAWLNLAP